MAKNMDIKEKEKLNHLVNISKSLIEVREKVKAEMEKLPPRFNLLDNIRNKNSNNSLQRFETYNSDLLYYLLNIKRKNINFTKLFLEYLTEKFEWKFDLNNINIKVEKEYYTTVKIEEDGIEKNGRIDILIYGNINSKETKKSFAIIIENKINADDQDKQLKRYYQYISKTKGYGNNVYVIYLTPKIKSPKEYSLSEEYVKKLGRKFKNITHGDIGRWIETILKNKEYVFLHKENYKLLKSALIQIIDNEKSISGENEENNMEEEEIKKVLDKEFLKELKSKGELTKGKLDEYIEMFDKAKNLLVKEKIQILIKFTKKISNYLKSKNYKEGKDYTLLKDKDIINWMLESNYPKPIEFNINNIRVWLEYEKGKMLCYFGICTENKNMQIRIRKKLRTFIENIFNDFDKYKYREKGEWIFLYYIDIEKDNPKEIAQAMIDLYELLKKEIK